MKRKACDQSQVKINANNSVLFASGGALSSADPPLRHFPCPLALLMTMPAVRNAALLLHVIARARLYFVSNVIRRKSNWNPYCLINLLWFFFLRRGSLPIQLRPGILHANSFRLHGSTPKSNWNGESNRRRMFVYAYLLPFLAPLHLPASLPLDSVQLFIYIHFISVFIPMVHCILFVLFSFQSWHLDLDIGNLKCASSPSIEVEMCVSGAASAHLLQQWSLRFATRCDADGFHMVTIHLCLISSRMADERGLDVSGSAELCLWCENRRKFICSWDAVQTDSAKRHKSKQRAHLYGTEYGNAEGSERARAHPRAHTNWLNCGWTGLLKISMGLLSGCAAGGPAATLHKQYFDKSDLRRKIWSKSDCFAVGVRWLCTDLQTRNESQTNARPQIQYLHRCGSGRSNGLLIHTYFFVFFLVSLFSPKWRFCNLLFVCFRLMLRTAQRSEDGYGWMPYTRKGINSYLCTVSIWLWKRKLESVRDDAVVNTCTRKNLIFCEQKERSGKQTDPKDFIYLSSCWCWAWSSWYRATDASCTHFGEQMIFTRTASILESVRRWCS